MMHKRGMNPTVAKTLAGMGVDPTHRERMERSERGKVIPQVARLLEDMGVRVPKDALAVNEADSPLDMPGQAPGVDPNSGQRSGMQPQNKGQGDATGQNQQRQGGKQAEKPEVRLRKPATQMQTLQDVSDKMTEVTANIKTVDLLIQALTENKASDKSIEAHKLTLRGPIQAVVNAVNDLKKLVD